MPHGNSPGETDCGPYDDSGCRLRPMLCWTRSSGLARWHPKAEDGRLRVASSVHCAQRSGIGRDS